MLVFHSHCQMGNQMFIYACARSLSRKLNIPYTLSDLHHLRFFHLGPEDRSNRFKYRLFQLENKLPFRKYSFHHLQDNRIDYSDKISQMPGSRHWYYGYFQGEKYFYNNQYDLKNCFRIKQEYIDRFNQINAPFKDKKTMIVHIRLKDYKTFGPDFLKGPDLTLPLDYYHNLIKEINAGNDYQIIFLSDSINEIKNEFSYLENAYFSTHDAITDFQFILNSDIALIAHSSFGWWAAWLNSKPNKKIYVPDYFLGFKVNTEFPVNMIPNGWIRKKVIS